MKKIILTSSLMLLLFEVQAIDPLREYKLTPEDFKLAYREVKIDTPDGYRLHTWVIQPEADKHKDCTFVIAGSDAGNMGFSLAYAFHLVRLGFTVVTFDYRGFGHSSDFEYNPNNYYHSEYVTDFVAVMDWVKAEGLTAKTGVLAFSMGTLIASAGYERSPYDFLVGEAFIRSPQKNVRRIKQIKNKQLILPTTAKADGRALRRVTIPILLFASTIDEITTLKDSRHIAESHPNRRVITYEGEHLKGVMALGWERYIKEVAGMAE